VKKIPGQKPRESSEYKLATRPFKRRIPQKITKGIRHDRDLEQSWGKRESWEAKG